MVCIIEDERSPPDIAPVWPRRYYNFYDKDRDEVIDGDLQRYVIEGDDLRFDEAVPVPSR